MTDAWSSPQNQCWWISQESTGYQHWDPSLKCTEMHAQKWKCHSRELNLDISKVCALKTMSDCLIHFIIYCNYQTHKSVRFTDGALSSRNQLIWSNSWEHCCKTRGINKSCTSTLNPDPGTRFWPDDWRCKCVVFTFSYNLHELLETREEIIWKKTHTYNTTDK